MKGYEAMLVDEGLEYLGIKGNSDSSWARGGYTSELDYKWQLTLF